MTVCNTIYLTRHGETDWNIEKKIQGSTDIPLNETGLNQAYQLANKIKDSKLEIDFIYTSSLKRAEDTAKIISHCNQIPFYSYDGLAEMNLGKWEGLTWSQVRNIYSTDYNIWHKERRYTIPPEGESYQQLLERFLNTIKENKRPRLSNGTVCSEAASTVLLRKGFPARSHQ